MLLCHDIKFALAKECPIPVVKARRGDETSLEALLDGIGKEKDIEGYVLRFD